MLLVLIYLVVSTAAQAYGGTRQLEDNADDVLSVLGGQVFSSPWDKLLILAVLTSAAASTQTTILPTARTTLSMARKRALPAIFARVHPRYLTPVVLDAVDGRRLDRVDDHHHGAQPRAERARRLDLARSASRSASTTASPGSRASIYYRRELTRSVRNFVFAGVVPLLGFVMLALHLRQGAPRLLAGGLQLLAAVPRHRGADRDRHRIAAARRRRDAARDGPVPRLLPPQAVHRDRAAGDPRGAGSSTPPGTSAASAGRGTGCGGALVSWR